MQAHSYLTIKEPSEGVYREKGSKFLAFAYPVTSEEEIRDKIEKLKKEYFDARHHCFAWMLGAEKNRYRAFDDGEPNHSAGDPILGQIRSKNLTNIVVVVVRYFGGVKLGVGGLINAYKTAAGDALNNALMVEEDVTMKYTLTYSYSSTTDVMRLVHDCNLKVLQQAFGEDCVMHVKIRYKDNERFLDKIKLMQATGTSINIGE